MHLLTACITTATMRATLLDTVSRLCGRTLRWWLQEAPVQTVFGFLFSACHPDACPERFGPMLIVTTRYKLLTVLAQLVHTHYLRYGAMGTVP